MAITLAAGSICCGSPEFPQSFAQAQRGEQPVAIAVRAEPLPGFEARDPARRRFGGLEFRGGLVLTSSHKDFGGLSAVRMMADGERFLALTDKGKWVRGRIVYEGGRPAALADVEIAPILGPDGRAITARRWYDTEGLAIDGGTAYVAIERVHQILRFDVGRHGLLARGQPMALPPGIKSLPANKGIEALMLVPKGLPLAGTLIAISERGLDGDGNILGFLIGGTSAGTFGIRASDDFDVTDGVLTPGGDLLLLERRYSLLRGVAMRIRRIPLASIRPGAVVDGKILIAADMGYQIDNMEGLAVHRAASGELVLTLVSDDNFSALQRTILLQFALVEP